MFRLPRLAVPLIALGVAIAGLAGNPSTAYAGTVTTLPVYYVGTQVVHREGGGIISTAKLYREFHRKPAGDGSVTAKTRAAVVEMLRPSAYDPDYRSYWPPGSRVRSVTVNGNTVTVDLTGVRGGSPTGDRAPRTVDQLVWTVTAASGKPLVRLLIDGASVDRLWGVTAVRDVMRRGDAVQALGAVWLFDPQQGDHVGRTFTMRLAAINPQEGTVYVQARQGNQVVLFDYVTMSGGAPSQAQGTITLTLPPGRYTVEAFGISMADGSQQFPDDHDITVG
jgi:hypothetical protein